MKKIVTLLMSVSLLFWSQITKAQDEENSDSSFTTESTSVLESLPPMSVGVGFGVLTGPEIYFTFQPSFMPKSTNFRALYGSFSFSADADENDTKTVDEPAPATVTTSIKIKADLDMSYFAALVDWHPFDGGFRLTAGYAMNGSKLTAKAEGEQVFEIAGKKRLLDALATAEIEWDDYVPYLGLGYGGDMLDVNGLQFEAGLGVYFIGSPTVDLAVSGSGYDALTAQEKADLNLNARADEIEDEIASANMWPHIYLGLSYKFN